MPSISGADLRYIQQRYMDVDEDVVLFDFDDEFDLEEEDSESSPPTHNKEARVK